MYFCATGTREVYTPNSLTHINFADCNAEWSRCSSRSRQSDHFIVYWQAGFGSDPNSNSVPSNLRVDIDDLLQKAEGYYALNIDTLTFATLGNSYLDDYKISIFLYYQTEWLATGSGYDDIIGALWVNPSTTQPAGPVIAHEIGHSFQYQVYADHRGGSGFRYGFGPNGSGGNGFWEQTAQWQAAQAYPNEVYNHNFQVYRENYHRHFHHEHMRYASYFLHYYWTDKHGKSFIGRLWQDAQRPEDPIEAYMRLTNIDDAQFFDEMYDAAARFVTWDLDELRSLGSNQIGALEWEETELAPSRFRVTYDKCPGTTGFNVIRLSIPSQGTTVSTQFTGIPNADGFNSVDASRAGWRYGYVALLNDRTTRVYSPMYSGSSQDVSFTIPSACGSSCSLWFVVVGAPNDYRPHAWDENNANDAQWPFEVAFTNTNLFGRPIQNGNGGSPQDPVDIEFEYDVTIAESSTTYPGPVVSLGNDLNSLVNAFGMTSGDISSNIGGVIQFYAVEDNGQLESQTTANGYGHWFDSNGDVVSWGSSARVYSEFDQNAFTFQLGQYPNQVSAGNSYTIRQALVYSNARATFTFNIAIASAGSANSVSAPTIVLGVGAVGLVGGLTAFGARRRRRTQHRARGGKSFTNAEGDAEDATIDMQMAKLEVD